MNKGLFLLLFLPEVMAMIGKYLSNEQGYASKLPVWAISYHKIKGKPKYSWTRYDQ